MQWKLCDKETAPKYQKLHPTASTTLITCHHVRAIVFVYFFLSVLLVSQSVFFFVCVFCLVIVFKSQWFTFWFIWNISFHIPFAVSLVRDKRNNTKEKTSHGNRSIHFNFLAETWFPLWAHVYSYLFCAFIPFQFSLHCSE